jgi:hypothetical protein
MHHTNMRWALRAGALALALTLPTAAQAATAPVATTGGAANVAQQTARLTGSVDPNGAATTVQFQYGTTSAYGAVTPEQVVTGDGKKTVTADISGLAPATTYHFRLIARNDKGLSKGGDRSFKTKVQPLGVTFAATPNPLLTGGTTTLAGQLTGTGNGGRDVLLQSNPFPYTQGFKAVGNKLVTDAAGTFSFGLQMVALNTQFRVALPDKPAVVSPIVVVSVSVRVSTHLGTKSVKRGNKLTFKGSVTPDTTGGTPIAIQKLNSKKHWVTITGTVTRKAGGSAATYSKRVTIRSGGKYRVYAGVTNGSYVPNTGTTVTIHTK